MDMNFLGCSYHTMKNETKLNCDLSKCFESEMTRKKESRIKNFPAADYVATGAGASGAGAAAASGAPPPAVFSNCKQKIGSSISKKVESNLLHTYNYVGQISFIILELKVIFS